MNRVLASIEKRRSLIESGLKPDGSPITGDLVATEKSLDNSMYEVMKFQELKSVAMLNGVLTPEEAQTIYMALGGEVPSANGWSPQADLATKVVVTGIMAELMARK